MSVQIRFKTENAAFADPGEVARILRKLAHQLSDLGPGDDDEGPILDANGNRVGDYLASIEADDHFERGEG